jgi:hypothetical protein
MIVGITGHRLLKHSKDVLYPKLQKELNGCTEVHTGFAWGFDLFVAWYCNTNNIPFVAHLAFPDQWQSYPQTWIRLYLFLLPKAKSTIVYGSKYTKGIYFLRDEGIVNNSDKIVAYYDGRQKGGTFYTVKYAYEKQRDVINVL